MTLLTKRSYLNLIKLTVTISAFAFLIYGSNWGTLIRYSGLLTAQVAIICSLALTAHLVLIVPRWMTIVSCCADVRIRFLETFRVTLIAFFFNQILPTAVGGDVLRIAFLRFRHSLGVIPSASTVLIDRLGGLVAACVLLFVASLQIETLPQQLRLVIYGVAISSAIGLISAVVLGGYEQQLTERLPKLRLIFHLSGDIRRLMSKPAALGLVGLLSLLSQILPVIVMVKIGNAMGIHMPLAVYAVAIEIGLIASVVPLSLAGWGLREMGFVSAAAAMGIPHDAALAMSICFGLLLTAVSLPGLVVWWIHPYDLLPKSSMP